MIKKTESIKEICQRFNNDKRRMMDILIAIQQQYRCIDANALNELSIELACSRVEVEGVVSFYSFFSQSPKGEIAIYLCDDIIDRHAGVEHIADIIQQALDIKIGETTKDGRFSLDYTPCIGMSDQAPAALVNDIVLTSLSEDSIRSYLKQLQQGCDPQDLIIQTGDGRNADQRIHSMVNNNIHQAGQVLLSNSTEYAGLKKALSYTADNIIEEIIQSGLRGRGGAGFSCGQKWQMAASFEARQRYVICNADEGEPGTFKDRVLLTEKPQLLIEGMVIAGRAINSNQGIIYLRAEYRYLHAYLESVLQDMRHENKLGENIAGVENFNFDIRIQLGAGAYICGEESALISSCEGRRGEPMTRPPYPVEKGYLGCPTVVNNVETFCSVARIMDQGAAWFKAIGTDISSGTKLLSVCGDCNKPGVYEVPYGITINELLAMVEASDVGAVQVGGPSGVMIAADSFERKISFEDLATGGSIMIFSTSRDLLEIVEYFTDFFVDESCGYCTPCRVGNVFLQERIVKIRKGLGEPQDLEYLKELSNNIIITSRCGLGHTSPNPILSSMEHFPLVYSALLNEHEDGMQAGFNIQDALEPSHQLIKRKSYIFDSDGND
jgi:[NiFe] hydrogenase diaphorase moiety large subunit